MSLDVSVLKPDPGKIKKGVTSVKFTYNGIVSGVTDNKVTLELFLDPEAPIFIGDADGNLNKSIVYTQNFPSAIKSLSKTIAITVTQVTALRSCRLRLEARDSKGFRSACNSHIIIFK
ncbi:MAG: hypothetical protein HOP10_00620 [Chitinophagaceae bacterium]|nr:hypothetical protein [Chitinophagaceae bacterium]